MIVKFDCYDKYEAEKLSGFLRTDKDSFAFLQGISMVYENEVVLTLKDKTSHSVILRDSGSALRLNKAINDSLVHNKRISINLVNSTIEITMS